MINDANIVYDRFDRSTGLAFVSFITRDGAERAVREANGALAHGKTMCVSIVQPGASAPTTDRFNPRNQPRRSLLDRITRDEPAGRLHSRSSEPILGGRADRNDGSQRNVDSYRPGREDDRSPVRPRRGGGARRSRRGADRRGGMGRDGRPRKTKEELDQEMTDYFGLQETETFNDGGENGFDDDVNAGDADGMELETY